MKIKIAVASLLLAIIPGLSIAACSGYGHSQTAMSCAEGMILDEETGTCIPVSTS